MMSANATLVSLYMNLGTTISTLRKTRKIKQGAFAERCKISQSYLSLIEHNRKEPNLSKLKDIASVLNVPLPVIFFLSIEKGDVPLRKRPAYDMVMPSVEKLINDVFLHDEKLPHKK